MINYVVAKIKKNFSQLDFCIVGLLFDATMYYPSSFYFGGAVTLLGALVMNPVTVKELKKKK